MSRRPEGWVGALADASSFRPLAVLRIGLAFLLLVQAVLLFAYREWLLDADGLVAWAVAEQFLHPALPAMGRLHALLPPALGMGERELANAVLGLHAAGALLLLAGLRTRAAAALTWLTFLPLKNTGAFAFYGVGGVMLIALFYCVVMPVGRAWSLDARRPGAAPPDEGAELHVLVLRLHVCIIYAAAGLSKALGTQWWSGEAVWRALSLPGFAQFDAHFLAGWPLLMQALSVGAMLVQVAYPVAVWTRLRVAVVVAVELLHLGIAVFLGLWMFSAMMMLLNAAAFGESVWKSLRRREAR